MNFSYFTSGVEFVIILIAIGMLVAVALQLRKNNRLLEANSSSEPKPVAKVVLPSDSDSLVTNEDIQVLWLRFQTGEALIDEEMMGAHALQALITQMHESLYHHCSAGLVTDKYLGSIESGIKLTLASTSGRQWWAENWEAYSSDFAEFVGRAIGPVDASSSSKAPQSRRSLYRVPVLQDFGIAARWLDDADHWVDAKITDINVNGTRLVLEAHQLARLNQGNELTLVLAGNQLDVECTAIVQYVDSATDSVGLKFHESHDPEVNQSLANIVQDAERFYLRRVQRTE